MMGFDKRRSFGEGGSLTYQQPIPNPRLGLDQFLARRRLQLFAQMGDVHAQILRLAHGVQRPLR